MGINKVQLANGETLVDMSNATITEETVLEGYIGYGANGKPIVGKAASTKRTEVNVSLAASSWSSKKQTVTVPGVTAQATIIVGGDLGSEPEYTRCGVYCSGQGNGTLTFTCTTVPGTNLIANVAILT